ncbi:hypothetical protein VNO78_27075 [Psophocarpus tetragonolobus]|uniref:Response regulatory domain-containing protein n=1 Tax=Psophocarpus tetragonolobus TaxID=3891 RepID=A0AAN9S054_PSOTE
MDDYAFFHDVTKKINVPVIMMSLDGARSVVMKAINQGVCDYWINSSNSNDFDVDEPNASFAPPTKKPCLKWCDELHHQFVKVVTQVGLDGIINS